MAETNLPSPSEQGHPFGERRVWRRGGQSHLALDVTGLARHRLLKPLIGSAHRAAVGQHLTGELVAYDLVIGRIDLIPVSVIKVEVCIDPIPDGLVRDKAQLVDQGCGCGR